MTLWGRVELVELARVLCGTLRWPGQLARRSWHRVWILSPNKAGMAGQQTWWVLTSGTDHCPIPGNLCASAGPKLWTAIGRLNKITMAPRTSDSRCVSHWCSFIIFLHHFPALSGLFPNFTCSSCLFHIIVPRISVLFPMICLEHPIFSKWNLLFPLFNGRSNWNDFLLFFPTFFGCRRHLPLQWHLLRGSIL